MPDDAGRLADARIVEKLLAAGEQAGQRFGAAGRVVAEIGRPRVERSGADAFPRQAVPAAEVHFGEARILYVLPAPACQPATDRGRALQGRGEHHARQTVAASVLANAV